MIKILHTADIHLGIGLTGLGKTGDRVRAEIKTAFSRMVDLARGESVDAFLIAGDLFDSNNVSSSLIRFALGEIERLETIPCVILPGTHDCLEKGSIYQSIESEMPDNMHVLSDPSGAPVQFQDKELIVYGLPNLSNRSTVNPVKTVEKIDATGKHILMAHGSYMIPNRTEPDDHPFGLDDIDNSGFDYVALGHWHSFFELPTTKTKAVYCGSPEQVAFDQTGAGNIAMVTMADGTSVEKRSIGKLKWNEVELSTSNFKYTIEIERELKEHVGDDRLVRVKLVGTNTAETFIDIDEIQQNMADEFLNLQVVDNTEAAPKDILETDFPPTTILGQFVRQMSTAIEECKDDDEKALLHESLKAGYGLLSGKDGM